MTISCLARWAITQNGGDGMGKILITILFGLVLGIAGAVVGLSFNPNVSGVIGRMAFETPPAFALPSLQTITRDATSDREALIRITDYYYANEDRIATLFAESNRARLRALYAMYLIHTSQPYGTVEATALTLLGYLRDQRTSHCGLYAKWQVLISRSLGLEARFVLFTDGSHGWTEVKIDEAWELFDSTINTWISRPAEELQRGAPRYYRNFYLLAATDIAPYPDVVLLRQRMMALGISWAKELPIRVQPLQFLFSERVAWKS